MDGLYRFSPPRHLLPCPGRGKRADIPRTLGRVPADWRSSVFRSRLIIAALLGVAATATLSAQERKFDLAFAKDKDGKYVPYYQEMTTDLRHIIKVQGQDLTQTQKSTFWYKWTPTKEEAVPA